MSASDLLLAAPSPSRWFAAQLPVFTGRYDAAGSTGSWAGPEAVLASLPAVHARLVGEYDATPAAAAKWLVSWVAGELAGAVAFTLATASAGLLVEADAVRWRVEADGRPGRVDPGPVAVAVAAGHPWAGMDGVRVVEDPTAPALAALVDVAGPLVEACRRLGRVGRSAAWTEVADGVGSAVLHVPGLPVDQRAVDAVRAALDAPGAPWRQRPTVRVAETAIGPLYLGRKAGCCLSYQTPPGPEPDPATLDAETRAYRERFPRRAGEPLYCGTCSLRDAAGCEERQVYWWERRRSP
ncbi:hypothetical protein [Pseudonocardia sp. 73-21]|uniref:hypothetical protein n=1 Tax=Pseudonocardia sp. 73-21 TaxID=1895809 RepID=UPI000964CFAD|nr:hypothetical protein [Pseudonocardia sp. 73-21]OJY53077.1 MAG: hypothetical protein BGP03_01615 [Pseudonocardia sp. 73-21]